MTRSCLVDLKPCSARTFFPIHPLLLAILVAVVLPAASASAGWDFETEITVTSTKTNPVTGFQVLVELTPGNFDYSHANADGSDIRFTTLSGSETFDIPHFIESWNAGGTSRIWAKVASVPALSTNVIFLRHGNPTATTSSDFATTFPNAFISTGADTLGGVQTFDWFEIQTGHTVTVTPGAPLEVTARNMIVVGTVDATGAGPAGVGQNTNGNGPGAGTTSPNSGAGGGSYGGTGGTGGYDSGDSPGTGGITYGTATGTDIAMGSGGGGATGASLGVEAGGAVSLTAQDLAISGSISADGKSPVSDGTGRGAGGSSGGGIALFAYNLSFSGSLSARGGNGATGTSTANDSGGGGGGGRIKLFAEASLDNSGSMTVTGGTGGPNGTAAPGQPGGDGSTHSDTTTLDFEEILATIGAETEILPGLSLSTLKRFPSTRVGSRSRPQKLILTNTGSKDLESISVRLDGVASREYRVSTPLATLAPGDSTMVDITFEPKRRGNRTASLTVASTLPDQTATLTGTGILPGGAVSPPNPGTRKAQLRPPRYTGL